jgi:hypothetical protein
LQSAVLDTISLNTVRYVDELALLHLRPGTINNNGNDYGSLFYAISDIAGPFLISKGSCGKLVALVMPHPQMLQLQLQAQSVKNRRMMASKKRSP